jgi:hypothetical protein
MGLEDLVEVQALHGVNPSLDEVAHLLFVGHVKQGRQGHVELIGDRPQRCLST